MAIFLQNLYEITNFFFFFLKRKKKKEKRKRKREREIEKELALDVRTTPQGHSHWLPCGGLGRLDPS
jgi:hypothetical protein